MTGLSAMSAADTNRFGEMSRRPSNSGETLNQAVLEGDVAKVRFLLKHGGQCVGLSENNKHGRTPLQQSCLDGNQAMVRELLDHGANIESEDCRGRTALHFSVVANSNDIAAFLIDSCANIVAVDKEGQLPVDLAQSKDMLLFLTRAMHKAGYEETSRWYLEKWGLKSPRWPGDETLSSLSSSDSESNDSDLDPSVVGPQNSEMKR